MYAVLLSHKIVNVDIKCMKRGKCKLVNVNETVLVTKVPAHLISAEEEGPEHSATWSALGDPAMQRS